MLYRYTPVKIMVKELAARCQIFYSKIYGFFYSLRFPTTVKQLNICGIKILRFKVNYIFVQINFGVQDTPRAQIIRKPEIFSIEIYIVASNRIASQSGIRIMTIAKILIRYSLLSEPLSKYM